jgi:hypothetical protein
LQIHRRRFTSKKSSRGDEDMRNDVVLDNVSYLIFLVGG